MLWLYINFPSLQLDCLQASQLKPVRGKGDDKQAIVIVDSKKNCIVQLNERAKAEGIQLGMGLAMAASLTDTLQVLPYQHEEQEAHLFNITEQLYSVTANIALFPPQGLALKVGNMLKLYQHIETYMAAVKAVLQPFNLNTAFAYGYSPMSAQLLACSGTNMLTADKSVIAEKMATLDIEELFIADKSKQTLKRLGIKTLAQLQSLPVEELAKRLDKNCIDYLMQLTGKHNTPLSFYQPKHSFEHSIELLYEMTHVDALLQPIRQLLKLLQVFLIRRDYTCLTLEFILYHRMEGLNHVVQQSFVVSSAAGEYLATQWLNLVVLKLSSIQLQAAITKITLCVQHFQNNTGEVADMFLGKRGQLSLTQLASLLVNKLGTEKVLALQAGNDHRVEFASTYLPVISQQSGSVSEATYQKQAIGTEVTRTGTYQHIYCDEKALLRPSFVLSEPEPLHYDVSILHGPERIMTAWWESSTINTVKKASIPALMATYHRDYFVARNKQGQYCWVYKECNEQWFVHGYFS